MYSKRDLATMFGVSERTIQFYTDTGLLKPKKYGRGAKMSYKKEDERRLRTCKRLVGCGLTLKRATELLDTRTRREINAIYTLLI